MSDELFGTLSDVESKAIRWLWKPYIAYGMLTLLEGDPNVGKSYLSMHVAAQVTKGGELPGSSPLRRGRVLYLGAEDDPAITIRPRIEAMGGNPRRVRFLTDFLAFDDQGLARLRDELSELTATLIVVDTLYAFVPSDKDPNKPNDVREVLIKVGRIASESGAAVLIIRHWTKGERGKAIYRGSGSIDIMGVARSAIAVAKHPEEPELRVMAHVKHNLSQAGESRVFKLVQQTQTTHPVLTWRGTTEISADDLERNQATKSAVETACAFLSLELKHGPLPAVELQERAEKRNISKRALQRAKSLLGIKSQKEHKGWVWSLAE